MTPSSAGTSQGFRDVDAAIADVDIAAVVPAAEEEIEDKVSNAKAMSLAD